MQGKPLPPRRLFAPAIAAACVLGAGVLASGAAPAPSIGQASFEAVRFDPAEAMPGGGATSRKSYANANAFSHSSGNLPFEDELKFKVGNGIFKKVWVSAPASTKASDGLGPLYNAKSCQTCHVKDGRGQPPEAGAPEGASRSMLMRLSIPAPPPGAPVAAAGTPTPAGGTPAGGATAPEPVYGRQLQDLSVQGHEAEGKIAVSYTQTEVKLRGGEVVRLRKPAFVITDLGYGPLHPHTMFSPRVAPPMIGLGLLEAIPDAAIIARADPDDADGDGISGRPHFTLPSGDGKRALARFGWKATLPSIREQTAEAFLGDIGISSPLLRDPAGECTERQSFCRNAPHGATAEANGAEIEDKLFDLVVFYSQNLAVPARRLPQNPDILAGKALFHETGCAACHTPSFTTGEAPGQPHLSGQVIWPYTDLLLHDMGEGLADYRPDGDATGREWRTPPLWGIGLTQIVNGHSFFLHDGRARNVQEAILWHGGEAGKSRDAFAALTKQQRERLIAFVNSL